MGAGKAARCNVKRRFHSEVHHGRDWLAEQDSMWTPHCLLMVGARYIPGIRQSACGQYEE